MNKRRNIYRAAAVVVYGAAVGAMAFGAPIALAAGISWMVGGYCIDKIFQDPFLYAEARSIAKADKKKIENGGVYLWNDTINGEFRKQLRRGYPGSEPSAKPSP